MASTEMTRYLAHDTNNWIWGLEKFGNITDKAPRKASNFTLVSATCCPWVLKFNTDR